MRRVFLALSLGVAVVPTAAAQRYRLERARRALFDEAAVELGVTGSVNRTAATGIGPADPQIRGSGGIFLSLPIAGRLRFRPELSAAFKAIDVTTEFVNPCLVAPCPVTREVETTSTTWLEAPLLAEVRFPHALGRRTSASLLGGPFLAIRLDCSRSVPVDPTVLAQYASSRVVRPCEWDGARFRDGDAGFVVGAAASRRGLGLGVRWTRSLTTLVPHGDPLSRLAGAKLSTLGVTVDIGTRLN